MHFRALATDYDGTIAHHGAVDTATIDALCAFKNSGRKVLLVTGREMHDLRSVFSEIPLFDRIVAENGGVLYNPEKNEERLLAPAPPETFIDALREASVKSLSVGKVIVATQEVYLGVVEKAICECEVDLQIILNKGSLMVLPSGITKATGLRAACDDLGIEPSSVVAVGDAENDLVFFKACGYAAAVANALPEVKAAADITMVGDHGTGVRELIGQLLKREEALSKR